ECPLHRSRWVESASSSKLIVANEAELHAQIFKAEGPFPVVAAGEIDMRRQHLARKPASIDGPHAEVAHGAIHGEDTAFPRCVEHRLVRFGLDLAEALQ